MIILDQNGKKGSDGEDGLAGVGGTTGCQHKCKRTEIKTKKQLIVIPFENDFWLDNFEINCDSSNARSGKSPSDFNRNGLKQPVNFTTPIGKYVKLDKIKREGEESSQSSYLSFYNALNTMVVS